MSANGLTLGLLAGAGGCAGPALYLCAGGGLALEGFGGNLEPYSSRFVTHETAPRSARGVGVASVTCWKEAISGSRPCRATCRIPLLPLHPADPRRLLRCVRLCAADDGGRAERSRR